MKKIAAILSLSILCFHAEAQLRLPAIIRDSMILQRDQPARIWGRASPYEKIRVLFKKKIYSVQAGSKGTWSIKLPAMPAGGPHTLEISSPKKRIVLREILFGDVFFCSGQSNMVHQLDIHDVTYAKEIAEANHPDIRQFWIPSSPDVLSAHDDVVSGNWQPAVGEKVRPFSAVAYFFALQIKSQYGVPVGIINSSVGGTPAEAWISEAGLSDIPFFRTRVAENKDSTFLRIKKTAAPPPVLPADQGLISIPAWYATDYEPRGWRPVNIPGYWEDQGIRDLDGTVWYRRELNLPASVETVPARMHLGRIVDADELYINGKKLASTSYMYPQRRYHLPAGTLKAGKNIFVIRVTNYAGKGGFVPDKPYHIVVENDSFDLKGTWHYKVGRVFTHAANPPEFREQNEPTALFNGMVAPFINYTIKAICWYQGESNSGRPAQYQQLLPALINDWRKQWQQPALPFLYVQLPGFMDYQYLPSESSWAALREAQTAALAIPHTAMATTIDLGEWNDIHPENKKDVGERLALAARHLVYGEEIVYAGPLPDTTILHGDRIEIRFQHTGSGLITRDGEPPAEFAIAGSDKKFVWAQARIEGNSVIVWSPDIKVPRYVRYAWADNPVNPNLINREGLPATPFRTDK